VSQATRGGVEKGAVLGGRGEMQKVTQDCNNHSVKMKRYLKELRHGLRILKSLA